MNMRNDLIAQIASDLKINKFDDENQSDYINRLIYSAIATWITESIWDNSFDINYKETGVSKSYLTRKISKIVSEFVAIFPSFGLYLDGLTEAEFSALLREYYEKAGYFVPVGFGEFIVGSSTKIALVNDNWMLVRNKTKAITTKTVGLGTFLEGGIETEFCSIDELFYLPKPNAQKWTEEYIKKIKWVEATQLGTETQFFDSKRIKKFSDCWTEQFPESCGITLYKTNNWDYGFSRKKGEDIVGVKVPEWLIGLGNHESEKLFDNDVRRFMYGLKAINNNKTKAIVYKKEDYYELKLLNALPTRELTTLLFMSWRKKGFLDEYNYIVPWEFFDPVKNILEKLSMQIEEK